MDSMGQEEVQLERKFWSDGMRKHRAHLFWTLLDPWQKKKGDKCRAGLRGLVDMSVPSFMGVRVL